MKYTAVFFYCILFIWSCSESKKPKSGTPEKGTTGDSLPLLQSGIDVEPGLLTADSIQIIYYDDPDGDTLRYARFFSFYNTSDNLFISKVQQALKQPASQFPQAKKCRSEGKMYLLKGENPVKTIYFSRKNSDCSYLYFIKDGMFYYIKMLDELATTLNDLKSKARGD